MTVAGWVGCVQYAASGRVGPSGARVQCPAAPDNAVDSAPASVLRPQQTLDRVLELVNRPAFATNNTVLVSLRYDTRCYFNVRSKADISQLNLPHGADN